MVEMVKSSTVAYRDFSAANVESLLDTKQQDWSESNEPSFRADFSALSIKPEFSRSVPIKSTKDSGKSGNIGNRELDSELDLWSHHSRKNNISLDRPMFDNNTSPVDQELEERRLSNDIGSNYILSNPVLNNSTDTLRRDDDSQIENGIDSVKTQHLMKPEMVYRLIRQKIGPKDFELFSKAIARFNSGTESCEETMKSISNIVGDKHLIEQMKMHIMNAANA